jgi:hypothetical protein
MLPFLRWACTCNTATWQVGAATTTSIHVYGSLSSYYTLEYLYIHTEIRTDQLLVPYL